MRTVTISQSNPTGFYTVGAVSTSSEAAYLGNFTYTAIGNISSSTDAGAYTYAETGTTNPHAATSIDGVSLAYDNNGNLTNHGTSTYEWDYRNRLTASNDGTSTTTYAYDHTFERVSKTASSSTTVYPNQFYEAKNASTTKYVFANNTLVAYIEADGESTTTVHYVHPDHLGGTNVVTDESGGTELTQAYYPFGSERISDGTSTLARGFIGEYEDEGDMSYLNARYYESDRGQFISQDPVFWEIALTPDGRSVLMNPQAQNSYSYALNSPVTLKDPTGRATYLWNNGAGMSGYDTGNKGTYYEFNDQAMLAGNAAYMQSLSNSPGLKHAVFAYKVWPRGDWDFKAYNKEDRGYYFFNGELVDAEDFGNRHYGYVGAAGGFGATSLYGGATFAAFLAGTQELSQYKTFFDNPTDHANIKLGIDTYYSNNYQAVNNAASSQSVKSALKSVSGSPSAARSLLNKAVKEIMKRIKKS